MVKFGKIALCITIIIKSIIWLYCIK